MKKIWFLLFVLLVAGCSFRKPQVDIQKYNNQLLAFQEQSVETLENYYQILNKEYSKIDLEETYQATLQKLQQLATDAETYPGVPDEGFKAGVVAYISGVRTAFMQHEYPTVRLLVNLSGDATEFYRKDSQQISANAMKLQADLAKLDKDLDFVYQQFKGKYLAGAK